MSFSSGKNMGAFQGRRLSGGCGRILHAGKLRRPISGRRTGAFPTNTPGWWGGAHPFTLLNWSTVHNGEISSYDANKRFIEMFGYKCNLMTDTEVITYLIDYLVRKQEPAAGNGRRRLLRRPFWEEIDCHGRGGKKAFHRLCAPSTAARLSMGLSPSSLALPKRLHGA